MRVIAAALAVLVVGVGCGSPADNADGDDPKRTIDPAGNQTLTDPNAKGPARPVEGARQGGRITVLADVAPATIDPTAAYSPDSASIAKLLYRTLATYDIRDGKPVLVPDLAEDLGTVSADKLTWTFKLKPGITYQDGSPVRAADFAYAIKRSFAHDIYSAGPSYQLTYFKDHDTYQGPYQPGGADYAGVQTPDDRTLVIKLDKPFPDLPYYTFFQVFSPIPQAKDTKQNYEKQPMVTGPYQVDSYQPGRELRLSRNPHWKAETDPVRHQFADRWHFKFDLDEVKIQRQVLASTGPDATALTYGPVDASVLSEIQGAKRDQLITASGPCTKWFPMDTRKIPLEVRRAIAVAFPYDDYRKVSGLSSLIEPPASTYMAPSTKGFRKYEVPGLTGTGPGDPAKAREMLKTAGKEGFELQWYFANDDHQRTQVSQVLAEAFQDAGFRVKQIGVPKTKIRKVQGDQQAPVNVNNGVRGFCADWLTPSSWLPTLFKSQAIAEGNSAGQLQDRALDAEIDRVMALPQQQMLQESFELERKIMENHLPALPISYQLTSFLVGTNIGNPVADETLAMPHYPTMYVRQP